MKFCTALTSFVLRALNALRRSVLYSNLRAKRGHGIRVQCRRGVLLILSAIGCRVELQQGLPTLKNSLQALISPPGNSACTSWKTAAFVWRQSCALSLEGVPPGQRLVGLVL